MYLTAWLRNRFGRPSAPKSSSDPALLRAQPLKAQGGAPSLACVGDHLATEKDHIYNILDMFPDGEVPAYSGVRQRRITRTLFPF